MAYELRLYEDIPEAGQSICYGDGAGHALYVAAGSAMVDGTLFTADKGVVKTSRCELAAGEDGATIWRWQFSSAGGDWSLDDVRSTLRLAASIQPSDIADKLLVRLDSVAFPPAGTAMLHVHQGPGIRCLKEGSIRIDTEGQSHMMGPGAPWFEAGPEPVFAQADMDVPSRFIRVMLLPAAFAGQSSIRYVNEEDKVKPKSQTYHVYDEALLDQ